MYFLSSINHYLLPIASRLTRKKSEIRISKSETNSKLELENNSETSGLEFWILVICALFRISDFEIRIFAFRLRPSRLQRSARSRCTCKDCRLTLCESLLRMDLDYAAEEHGWLSPCPACSSRTEKRSV